MVALNDDLCEQIFRLAFDRGSELALAAVCKERRRTAMAAVGARTLFHFGLMVALRHMEHDDFKARVRLVQRALKAGLRVQMYGYRPIEPSIPPFYSQPLPSQLREHKDDDGTLAYSFPQEHNLDIFADYPDGDDEMYISLPVEAVLTNPETWGERPLKCVAIQAKLGNGCVHFNMIDKSWSAATINFINENDLEPLDAVYNRLCRRFSVLIRPAAA